MANKAAADLVRERWKKTTPEQRSKIARALNEAKYANMSEEERKAIGQRLAAARKKARNKKKTKPRSA